MSGADVIPNASRLKQNLPNGVINVVNLALSGCRGICQSPLDVSSLEKYRAPASLGAISSKVGRTNLECSLHSSAYLDRHRSLVYHYFSVLTPWAHTIPSALWLFRLYQILPSAWAPLLFLAVKEKLFFLLCWCNMVGPFPAVGSSLAHTFEQAYISKQLSIRKYGNWSWLTF